MSGKFGIKDKDWEIFEELLICPLKTLGFNVWIFGSRATGTYKKFSDVDVLYASDKEVPLGHLYLIRTNLEESDLTLKVDLVDINHLAKSYLPHVLQERVAL